MPALAAGALPMAACAAHPPASRSSGLSTRQHPPPSSGIPPDLLARARPIGVGPRFRPPVLGPVTGDCRPRLGIRHSAHLEVFAANRVVIVPAGIGTRPPRRFYAGRIADARCYGDLVTVEPTGVVLSRAGVDAPLADLFRAWGQPLTNHRIGSFTAPGAGRVRAYVNGRPWTGRPQDIRLGPRAEIVLEVGPYVPPHPSYTFPPEPPP